MENIQENVLVMAGNAIQTYAMIGPGDHVIAGVSGGADSVCLLHVLKVLSLQMSFTLEVIHVEHGLRGREALRDAEFTKNMCDELAVPCRIVHVDVEGTAKAAHVSTEEAGRSLRYAAFEEAAQEWETSDPLTGRCVRIATAHHMEDQAETLLLNLARGTGLRGMGGIRPVTGRRIRPLLFISRCQIEDFLRLREIPWRTDATNLETVYARNKIRHQILPVLKDQVNEATVQHLAEAAQEAGRTEEYIRRQTLQMMEGKVRFEKTADGAFVRIKTAFLLEQEELIREYALRILIEKLREGLALKDITREHIRQLKDLTGKASGKMLDLPAGLKARRQKEYLYLYTGDSFPDHEEKCLKERLPAEGFTLEIGGIGEEKRRSMPGGTVIWKRIAPSQLPDPLPEKKYTKWLSYDTMMDTLCLRTRRSGDHLIVDRTGGRCSLKKFLIDRKIPRETRDLVLLVAQKEHVLWVVGERISEKAKVNADTAAIVEITVIWEE